MCKVCVMTASNYQFYVFNLRLSCHIQRTNIGFINLFCLFKIYKLKYLLILLFSQQLHSMRSLRAILQYTLLIAKPKLSNIKFQIFLELYKCTIETYKFLTSYFYLFNLISIITIFCFIKTIDVWIRIVILLIRQLFRE